LTFGPSSGSHSFTTYSQRSGVIGAQKILKKFPLDVNIKNGTGEVTIPGPTGMLINGVEINNYKSNDKIYYGPIESINVLNGGNNYDVISPPLITISAGSGTTALVQPVISGSITSVYVDSQDYDINTVVSIGVSGRNGSGAVLEPIIKKRIREIFFDGRTTTNSGGISTTTRQLTFLTDHNLINGEAVIYNSNGNSEIGVGLGSSTLINNATYYAKIDNNTTVRLYQSISDYSSGINTIRFSGNNTSGIHKFRTTSNKNTISEIKVINGGSGYTNRKLIVNPTGISTINHMINFKNHGFNSGELVTYTYQTSTIGISTSSQYYILKNDNDSFRLCDAGIGGTNTSNYDRKDYIKFSSTGSGYQYFNYPDISVSIQYTSVGFGTITQEYQTLIATPKVRGSIIDVYLYENGTGYGSTILNLQKQPLISIKNGKEAQLKPIIINGTINSVNIQYGGLEYYSNPDLVVVDPTGVGSGAELIPVIIGGKITDVKIINSGIGYSNKSTIQVKPAGSNAVFSSNIRSLTVNNNIKFGNELLLETQNKLQYSVCGYFNTLRESFGDTDTSVSNIIGWAYDGNPIYGPYAYPDPEIESGIKLLTSGYELNPSNIIDRPIGFSDGFFVEDYEYTNCGDLDENNGRFSKTPEFPNGVYAYFATVQSVTLEPQFPYFIGNKYRSNTLEENLTLNQSFDFNNSNLLRNTFPYKVSDNYADNDFIIETNEITKQKSVIESVSVGYVNDFDIINAGSNYNVNDILNFDNTDTDTEGGGLIAKISSVKGRDIVDLNTSVQTYQNAIVTWNNERELNFTILPNHNLSNNDYVSISGFSTNLSKLNNFYQIGVSSYYSNVLKDIPTSTAGLTTEIYVSQLPTSISVGSSITIGTETLSVLEVFKNINILKVKRGSTGVSHTATTQINFIPNSFTISENIDYFESKVNDKVYFNPKESVGIGTTTGITNSITLQFGDSTITRNIPTQGIYIENHPFTNNQRVVFTSNGAAIAISTSSSGSLFNLPQNVYVTNKNKNTIGIKTTLNSSEVFFITNGDDSDEYSFESLYTQKTGNVDKIKCTVSVSTYHGLTSGDIINLNVQPNLSVGIGTSTSVYVKRDVTTGNILINPIGFNSTGINTTTNTITINSHNLNTGDKVLYSANVIASGLSTGTYYVYKVDNNKIKLSKTYIDCKQNPPTTVSIASTGGANQSISLINPQIKAIKNNNLVFKLSDTSLSGYNFKIYYDQNLKNEFTSTATTGGFTVSGVGTVGVSTNALLTINYDTNLPTKLYYSLEKSGDITSPDIEVNNYSEILFTDSYYNSNYSISGVGSTTFNICLSTNPEKLTYLQNECDILDYTTNSISAKGPINTINIISGGTGYKKLPIFVGSNSAEGKDAYIIAKSLTIGNAKEVRIINEGFEYSSDKTLQPTAYISPLVTIKNSNTIGIITVTDGGKGYTNAPSIVIVDSITGEKIGIGSGILEAKLSGNSISAVNVVQSPKGLPETTIQLFATNNTNGISIQKVESSSSGIFTCFITTPVLGFESNPFNIGDEVFVEGIQKFGTDGSGFNSEDYGFKFFTVEDYDNSGSLDKVVIKISDLPVNTGIAKTIQDSVGNIIKRSNYPFFEVTQISSPFITGEKLICNNIETDLVITSYDDSFIKVFGTYELLEGQVIIGKESANIATVDKISNNFGRFEINYSVRKDIGWENDIGKLNEDSQVTPDNDYYQNLSYTVKSPITYQNLRTPVNSLLHTSGLKNFADTGITSTTTSQISSSNATTIIRDVIEENRVDTIYDFDLVKDIDIVGTSSKFLKLKNKKLTDYTECKTNVVLRIDDISRQFSNLDGEPSEFLNILELNSGMSYDNLLFRVSNSDNTEIQLTELVLLNNGVNNFLLEKGTVVNAGVGLTHIAEEQIGVFSLIEDEYGNNNLQFLPTDPYNVDYDLKLITNEFNSTLPGIGTTSIGFINLTGCNVITQSGITTSIISLNSNNFSSLHANIQVIDLLTNQMNFAEIYLSHDGTNTYLSEYYFDSEYQTNNYSGNFIGSFSANISSGVLSLNYTNDSSNNTTIRSKIVGFGTTAVGTGTYRFKLPGQLNGYERTAIYQSNYASTVSAASTSLLSLSKTDFNAVKSLIKVSVGSTSALHQIMLVQDTNNVYIQQSPFLSIGSTTGIGTFGAEYSGNNFSLKFYPDSSITSTINILSFNQCLYTSLDDVNIPPNLTYGTATESVKVNFYNSINGDRINRTDFDLTSDGYPIFAQIFDPSNTLQLDRTTGTFTIPNHFFSNTEQLIYTPKSTFLGIGSTAMMISPTNVLPSTVFAIKVDDDTFKLATTKNNAQSGIAVTFTSIGEGNAHELAMSKRNEKAIITIDNLVQYPLLFTPISHTLSGNGGQISTESTLFALSGISTIKPKDILKIDSEYMAIINVGLGTTNIGPITNSGTISLVEVSRGFVGSSATSHTDSTTARVYKGSYNIVGNKIFFAEPPRGNPQIERDSSNLRFETSDFTGRVFLRNNYTTNQIYDDISNQFTGIGRTFTLTVGGANTVGLGSTGGNGILFINSVFQTPTTNNNPNNNFRIVENSTTGISSVIFSGIQDPDTLDIFTSEFDINQNQTPRGGIIISLGSSTGLGYAPLVGAAVTAVVGAGGSIVSVGLGTTDNLGSGYNGIVSIGVSVYESGHNGTPAVITASVGAGGKLSFNVGAGGTGYTNPKIFVSEPSYENLTVTGVSRLGIGATTKTGVGLLLNVEVGVTSTAGIGSTYFGVNKFNISRQGYSFQRGDVFKPVGLVTDSRLASPLSEFKLTVIDTFTDSFAAWQFGEFDYIDSIKNYQDGIRTRFPLFYNSELLSFEAASNSQVNLSNALLIVINGVIQDPEVAYQFDGGTSFVFTTAPKPEDNVAIFFYRGTAGDDSILITDINETIKRGDTVQVLKNNSISGTISQNKRTVFDLSFSDKFETNLYSDQGIDTQNHKPLSWTKQKSDRIINGENVYKTRDSIESLVYPTAKVIKNFSSTDTEIFVDNAEFFKYDVPALADFDALVVNGISTSVNGSIESITNISLVNGFSGIITGITTATGSGGNPLALKFYVEVPSVGLLTQLQVGYPIYIFDTRVGNGVTSIDNSNTAVIGIGSTFLDNIYYVHQFSYSGTAGIITCNIKSNTSVVGLTTTGNISNPIGKFSWGRMTGFSRSNSPISIGVSGNTIDVGLSTFPTIQRRGTGLRSTGALPKVL
jgi:hypothetical protein